MRRALDLGWRGWGRVHPNPMVGAVVLAADGTVLGEGFHAEFGGLHAELQALAAVGDRARGATLVSTLEPCNHTGKQPPCTEAILRAGVRRVVAALGDPNPVAAGGADRLRSSGVEVDIGLMAAEAARQNAAFLHNSRDQRRPFVALKLATSVDFRIADSEGRSRWVSGSEARDFVHWLRAGFDGIGVGLGTALADDPRLGVRGAVAIRVPPVRIVFDRRLELPPYLDLVRTSRESRTVVVAEETVVPERVEAMEALGLSVLRTRNLGDALHQLRTTGVSALLIEGGGRLAGALLDAGLVDRFYWIQAPVWLGEGGVPAVRGLRSTPLEDATRWQPAERRSLGEDTLLVLDRA